jgi:glycosyltransferase involved in cell wall biosynthesis
MRYLLNTHSDDTGARVCITDLHAQLRSHGLHVTLNDWSAYKDHDVVVFMGYDHDIERAKQDNPEIKVVLADPKLATAELSSAARKADLLLVSSVEQRDRFLRLSLNVHLHYMFPFLAERPRIHLDDTSFKIAYHGNRVHLDAMRFSVMPALRSLAKNLKVELLCIYNVASLGQADLKDLTAAGIKVMHIQWTEETLVHVLAQADVGIMPNELPIRNRQDALLRTAYSVGEYAYEPFDHLVRYKASANPGRLLPFACAGLPVVADFCPSASQFIRDGESGFIVSSPHGWYFALSKLAKSAELRQTCADYLRELVISTQKKQTQAFINACEDLNTSRPPELDGFEKVEEEQRLFYRYPRPQETPLLWLRRQLKKYMNY